MEKCFDAVANNMPIVQESYCKIYFNMWEDGLYKACIKEYLAKERGRRWINPLEVNEERIV